LHSVRFNAHRNFPTICLFSWNPENPAVIHKQ
jgi:hypothetical protein